MRIVRNALGTLLVVCALAGAGCGDDEGANAGTQPSAQTPGAAATEEYDLALPDDGVEGDAPPGVGTGG